MGVVNRGVYDEFFLYISKSNFETIVERNVLTITDVLSNVGGYAEIIILIITFSLHSY